MHKARLAVSILLCLLSINAAYAATLRLEWDSNKEPDLWGYRVYYQEDEPGPPFTGTEALVSASPIQCYISGTTPTTLPVDIEGEKSGVTLEFPNISKADLDAQNRNLWFAVTAVDTMGRESKFSNQVNTAGGSDGTAGPPHPIRGLKVSGVTREQTGP